jgi:hypothetical protein
MGRIFNPLRMQGARPVKNAESGGCLGNQLPITVASDRGEAGGMARSAAGRLGRTHGGPGGDWSSGGSGCDGGPQEHAAVGGDLRAARGHPGEPRSVVAVAATRGRKPWYGRYHVQLRSPLATVICGLDSWGRIRTPAHRPAHRLRRGCSGSFLRSRALRIAVRLLAPVRYGGGKGRTA